MKRAQGHKARDLETQFRFLGFGHVPDSEDMYLSYKLHMNIVWIQKKLKVKKSRFTMVLPHALRQKAGSGPDPWWWHILTSCWHLNSNLRPRSCCSFCLGCSPGRAETNNLSMSLGHGSLPFVSIRLLAPGSISSWSWLLTSASSLL